MARRQSGVMNKVLNFIGLVDDEGPETAGGYSSDGYGRPATYVPQRQRANARPAQPTGRAAAQQPQRRTLPAAGRTSARTYGDERGYASSRSYGEDGGYRASSRTSGYDDGFASQETQPARASSARSRSRFEADEPQRRTEAPVPVQPQRMRVSRPQRTLMCSIYSLQDCREVIDNLVRGNTIVLSMEELDGHEMQRCVDTLSGAAFALHTTVRRASDRTYLIVPSGVEVSNIEDSEERL